MGKVEGGMKCVKYLLFIFNFIFWVSARFVAIQQRWWWWWCDAQVDGASAAASTSHLTSVSHASPFHLQHLNPTLFISQLASLFSMFLSSPSLLECSVRLTVRDGRRFVVRLSGLKSDFPQRKRTPSFSPGKRVFERKTE